MGFRIKNSKRNFLFSLLLVVFFGYLWAQHVLKTDPGLLVQPPKVPITTLEQTPGLHVLSFATNPKHPILQLLLSTSPYPIQVLGVNKKWNGLRDKFEAVHAYLLEHHLTQTQDIIVFVDGYDTLFVPGKQDIVKKFKAFAKPLVISAESMCFHHPICSQKNTYPKSPENTLFKYVNSGTYIGYASAVYTLLDEVLKQYPDVSNDQFLMHAYFMQHPERVTLDYHQEIFSLLFGTRFGDYVYDPKTGSISNLLTHTQPLILHGNGGPGLLLKLYRHYIGVEQSPWADWLYHADLRLRLGLLKAIQWISLRLYNNWTYYQGSHCCWLADLVYKTAYLQRILEPML